jgi:hypothetical protein
MTLSLDSGVIEPIRDVQWAGPSEFFPKDSECLVFDESGEQVFDGSASAGENELSEEISRIGDAYSNDVAGAALCSDKIGVAIFVSNQSPELMAEVEAVRAKFPALPVVVCPVALGEASLMDIVYRLLESDIGSVIREIGPDVYTGGLYVKVLSTAMTRKVDPVSAQSIYLDVKRVEGVELPVRVVPGDGGNGEVELMGGLNDGAR